MDNENKNRLLGIIKERVNETCRKYKNRLHDEMFSVGHGTYPNSEEVYEKINSDIRIYFDSHGLSKGHPVEQYEQLIFLLEKGVNKSRNFYTAPFEISNEFRAGIGAGLGTSGGTCYKDGFAIVISGYNKQLGKHGIKYVLINDVFEDIIDILKEIYEDKYI